MRIQTPAWVNGSGPESDVVVSTRARLARNLADAPFPEKAGVEELDKVAHAVRLACRKLEPGYGSLRVLKVSTLGDEEKSSLVDAHAASLEQVSSGPGRLIILDSTAELAIMVNEEDHLRIQSIVAGLDVEKAWRIVDDVDDLLSRELKYAFSEQSGYLTASLTNTGTGLRMSVMMHLAGLTLAGKLTETLKAAYDLGVSVRGLFGEGTKGLGDFYQVSNEITLGLPEKEIRNRVKVTAEYLVKQERSARERFLKIDAVRLREIAGKSLAAAKRCYQIEAQDALSLLSPIRLAVAVGAAGGCSLGALNELLLKMGAGKPSGLVKDRFHLHEDNTERASLLRQVLRNAEIKTN